jgi:hypothetical protein
VYGPDTNGDPIASAGADQVVAVGVKVELDGSASTDPEGDKLSYKWVLKSKPDGSKAALSDDQAVKPFFTADVKGRYTLQLVVNDGLEASQPDSVTVTALDDFKLQPVLEKIDPTSAYIGTRVKVTLTGKEFSTSASVIFNNTEMDSKNVKVVSATTIEATVDATSLIAKKYQIKVRNPNLKETKALEFELQPIPAPEITELTPPQGFPGLKITLKIKGKGFIKDSEVFFETTPLKTTYKSVTELEAVLDLKNVIPGKYQISVKNPGGLASKDFEFSVLNPPAAPTLKALNPPNAQQNAKIAFSAHGTGFIQGATILFNGKAIKTKRIRRDEVQADPELDLTGMQPGDYSVVVRNPDSQKTGSLTFTIVDKNPTPKLDRILPFNVYFNVDNTLYIYGSGFAKDAVLYIGKNKIDGAKLRWRSSTYMEATFKFAPGPTWPSGDIQAYVVNASSKKQSNNFKMTVTNLVPTINGMTPSSWTTKCDTDVVVNGVNFLKDTALYFGATKYSPSSTANKLTFVSDKELKFRLNATKMSARTYDVYVDNKGTKSAKVSFRINTGTSIPIPQIREARPATGQADTKVSVVLYYNSPGTFYNGAVVYLDGKPQKTTCSSTSTTCYNLTTELDLSGLKPGIHKLEVWNPCGLKSKQFDFLVTDPPTPMISRLSPVKGEVGSKSKVSIVGVNFSKKSVLLWGGKAIPVTFKTDKELITTNDVDWTSAKPGVVDVQVDNKNGQKSQVVKFSILPKNHPITITSLQSASFSREKVHKNVQVNGTGFTAKTELYLDGTKLSIKYKSAIQLTIDTLDLTKKKAGTYHLQAKDNGKDSNLFPLYAEPVPPPVIRYTSPAYVDSGASSRTLYIYGSLFCKISGTTCTSNPRVLILDSKNVDYGTAAGAKSAFNITRTYRSSFSGWGYAYVYGTLNASKLPGPGSYKIMFELPTGERSNISLFKVNPPPPLKIERISPTSSFAGTTFTLTVYAKSFCPYNSSNRCTTNPRLILKDSKGKDWASGNYKITYTYTSPSSSSARVSGPLNTSQIPPGTYQVQLEHPISKKISNAVTLTLRKAPDPYVTYINPYYVKKGQVMTVTMYGSNFNSGMVGRMGLNLLPTIYSSSTRVQIALDGKTLPEGPHQVVMINPNGQSSPPFTFSVVDKNPAITRIYWYDGGPYQDQEHNYITVYGAKWPTTTVSLVKFYVDNKLWVKPAGASTTRCYSSSTNPYCRLYKFNTKGMKAGNHTIRYEATVSGKLYKSPEFKFWVSKAPAPEIVSLSPNSVTQSSSTTRVRIYGRHFKSGAAVQMGLTTLPTSYSSASYLYVNIKSSTLAKKAHTLYVINPDKQKSNGITFTVK